MEKTLHLESWSFKYAEAFVEGPVVSMTLTKQESQSACTLGHSFGFNGNKVWVDKGARGWFKVIYSNPRGEAVATAGTNIMQPKKPP